MLEGIRIVRQGFPNRIPYAEFKQRYQILAASEIPQGFIEAKDATVIICKAFGLTDDQHKMGNTKVFFRSGILGQLEDKRDERITQILTAFQALARGWLARKIFGKLMEQRLVSNLQFRSDVKSTFIMLIIFINNKATKIAYLNI